DGVWTYTDVPRVGVNWVGTESAASASVTVDTTAPTVAISFPTAAAYNAGGWTAGQPIAGTASDATSGVASSAVSVQKGNGASSCWTGTGATFTAACPNYLTATGTTNWNKTFTTANFGADDTYTVAARATDNVGNTAVSSASFVYDTVAPAPAVVSPAFTSSTTPTVSGTAGVQGADATHSADASTVTVKIFSGPNTGGTLLQTINNVAVSGGNWSTPVAALTANAQYTAQVLQSDGAGNSGSGTKTFVVDTVAPAPAVVSPAFTSSTTPTVSGTAGVQGADATHSADASTVTVKIFSGPNTGGTLLQTINNVAVSGGNWSTPVAALTANAQYTAQVLQSDGAGNSGSGTKTFVVDTVAPAPAVVSPAFTSSTTPTVSGTAGVQGADATHSADASTVTVKIFSGPNTGGTLLQTINNVAVSGGNWSTPVAALTANAQYTAQVLQSDGAGNSGSGTKTFVVDTVAPAVTLTTPANNSSGSDTTPTFSGAAGAQAADATHSADSTTVTVYICSGTPGSCNASSGSLVQTLTTTASGSSWSVDASTLALGTYQAQAAQSDGAGNTGTSSANTFTVTSGLTITSVERNTGNRKYDFKGTGSATGGTVTVTICKVNTFPCPTTPTNQVAATATASQGSTWTTGQTNNNLDNSGNGLQYWAQATQGSATSAVFLFASTSAEPSAFDVALHNGGVANKADAGDTLVVTYSEPLDATTFCSSWTNVGVQSSSASVAINNTTPTTR